MNKLTIIGNLVSDPIYRPGPDGGVCYFSVVVNFGRSNKDYFNVNANKNNARICARYLKKGRAVGVTGGVHLNSFGEGASRRQVMTIYVDGVTLIGKQDEILVARDIVSKSGYTAIQDEEQDDNKNSENESDF